MGRGDRRRSRLPPPRSSPRWSPERIWEPLCLWERNRYVVYHSKGPIRQKAAYHIGTRLPNRTPYFEFVRSRTADSPLPVTPDPLLAEFRACLANCKKVLLGKTRAYNLQEFNAWMEKNEIAHIPYAPPPVSSPTVPSLTSTTQFPPMAKKAASPVLPSTLAPKAAPKPLSSSAIPTAPTPAMSPPATPVPEPADVDMNAPEAARRLLRMVL